MDIQLPIGCPLRSRYIRYIYNRCFTEGRERIFFQCVSVKKFAFFKISNIEFVRVATDDLSNWLAMVNFRNGGIYIGDI